MDLNHDNDEFSALEYAHFHGLCRPYHLEGVEIPDLSAYIGDEDDHLFPSASDDDITKAVTLLLKERLSINRDAAMLLKSVHDARTHPPPKAEIPIGPSRIMQLKQEPPLLRTDEELDVREFGKLVVPDLRNLRIPTEIINEEADEGLRFPAKYEKYRVEWDERVKAEKLAVSRDDLVFLQDAIRDVWSDEDRKCVAAEYMGYRPKKGLQPITPPLLPLSPPPTPYIPSSPANQLPLLSESSDSVTAEAQALEKQIMDADFLARHESDSTDSMLLDLFDLADSPEIDYQPSTTLKRRLSDLKVEGPLTPPILSDSPMKKLKSVSFTPDLPEIIPRELWSQGSGSDTDYGSSTSSEAFFNIIEPLAQQVNRMLANEKLSGADTTARVEVPHIDFVMPVAPWNEYSHRKGGKRRVGYTELDAQKQFLLRVKLDDLRLASSWPDLNGLDRKLRWSIFTSNITQITLDEELHGESEVEKILDEATSECIATSAAQVWKREGLRILDENEDEDEKVQVADCEELRSMETLVRKRKMEMDEEMEGLQAEKNMSKASSHVQARPQSRTYGLPQHTGGDSLAPLVKRKEVQDTRLGLKSPQASQPVGSDLLFGFSATTALQKFMQTRGKVMKESEESKISGKSYGKVSTHPTGAALPLTHCRATPMHQDTPVALPELPIVPTNLPPCSFIISSKFLQRRSLMKQIERLYPTADIFYRDYDLLHSPSKEADFILSPSTGLIMTTLQQIKQRHLPGQPDRSPVKERMVTLKLRYERLVLLVTEGLSKEMEEQGSSRPEDARDKEALGIYQKIADRLEGEVIVDYISGGEKALARETVLSMAKYGLPHGSPDIGDIKPLAAETSWEIFFRRLGLNPFAAQVILAWLKTPFDVPLPKECSLQASRQRSTVAVYGLSAFLVLKDDERIQYFQALLGGSQILRRVNKVLSQEWMSAVHGFRV